MSPEKIEQFSVSITDVFVALTCFWALFKLQKQNTARALVKMNYMNLFLAVGVAALFGAIHHSFFEQATGLMGTIPRFVVMISVGYAAMNLWLLGGDLVFSSAFQLKFQKAFRILIYAYIVAVIMFEQKFWLAICFYVPAVLFFMGTASYNWIRRGQEVHKWAAFGLLITLMAAGIQYFKIQLIPVYINHNSFYHLVQIPGIYLLFLHARKYFTWNTEP